MSTIQMSSPRAPIVSLMPLVAGHARFLRDQETDAEFVEVRRYLRHQTLARQRAQGRTFVVENEQRELVGLCAVARCPGSSIEAEIAYYIAARHRRRGYAVAAARALCAWAGRHLGVSLVRADCAPTNLASRRVLERAGFCLKQRSSQWSFADGRPRLSQETWRFIRAGGLEIGRI